jgi:4'-phosphopantetheinyl transferase
LSAAVASSADAEKQLAGHRAAPPAEKYELQRMITLEQNEIRLWMVLTEANSDSLMRDRCLAVLSGSEAETLRRMARESAADQYLVAHGLLRSLLSSCCDLPPCDWQFFRSAQGKPFVVEGQPPLRFSLTHTEGLVACAVSACLDVGVDAEKLSSSRRVEKVLSRLADSERNLVARVAADQRESALVELWTLKESYLKALGTGLALSLDSFAIGWHSPDEPRVFFPQGPGQDPREWRFFQLSPSLQHRLALCARSAEPNSVYLNHRILTHAELCAALPSAEH